MKIRALLILALSILFASIASADEACDTPPHDTSIGVGGFRAYANYVAVDDPLGFEPRSSAGWHPCVRWKWDFGDGTIESTDQFDVYHQYKAPGAYPVTVTVTNNAGSDTSAPLIINVMYGGYDILSYEDAREESGVYVMRIRRTRDIGESSVHYETSDATAKAGQQYVATSGTLTFADGETIKEIAIPIIDDHIYHQAMFSFRLSDPKGPYGVIMNPIPRYIVIRDADPIPFFSIAPHLDTISEGVGHVTFQITRSNNLVADQSVVAFLNEGPTEIEDLPVTFHPGETVHEVELQIPHDDVYRGDRTLTAGVSPDNGGEDRFSFTLKDDDPRPLLSIDDVTVGPAATYADFTVRMSIPAAFPLDVGAIPRSGTAISALDYDSNTILLHFAAGESVKTFRVVLYPHPEKDRRAFSVELSVRPDSSSPAFAKRRAACIIAAGPRTIPQSLQLGRGQTASLALDLGSAATAQTTVAITSSDRTVISLPETVTFNAGETRHSIDVTALTAGKTATITLAVGAPLSQTLTVPVSTYEPGVAVFSPQPLILAPYSEAPIQLSIQPPQDVDTNVDLSSSEQNFPEIPKSVRVPAGGSATVPVKTYYPAFVLLTATLPPRNGGASTTQEVTISSGPMTIADVTPAVGLPSTSIWTAVTVHGTGFGPSCSMTIGGRPAEVHSATADTVSAGVPPHAAGSVDIGIVCGTKFARLAHGFTYALPRPRAVVH